jgi:serine/threonine-protein kinase RsbW
MVQTHTFAAHTCNSNSRTYIQLQQSIPSEVAAISPLVDQLMLFISRFRGVDESDLDVEIAIGEALTNAVVHGNCKDCHKRVDVVCCCSTNGEVAITVRDEGQGFDKRAVPNPTSSQNVGLAHGRGIYLMEALMDEVRFEQGGTLVYMRKSSPKDR